MSLCLYVCVCLRVWEQVKGEKRPFVVSYPCSMLNAQVHGLHIWRRRICFLPMLSLFTVTLQPLMAVVHLFMVTIHMFSR